MNILIYTYDKFLLVIIDKTNKINLNFYQNNLNLLDIVIDLINKKLRESARNMNF